MVLAGQLILEKNKFFVISTLQENSISVIPIPYKNMCRIE
jgi:hypothetical protein